MFNSSVLYQRLLFFALFPLTAALSVNAAPVVPLTAVSRQHHIGVGDRDIPLPLAGPPGVECREVNGSCEIVLAFADPVTFTAVGITTGNGYVHDWSSEGAEITINVTGVVNGQRIIVSLSNVTDGITTSNVSVPLSVLLGDTTGDGRVNSSDISYTQFESGHVVTEENFRTDVTRNGAINSSDISAVQSQSGTAVNWDPPALDRLGSGFNSASLALEPDASLWSWGQFSGDGSAQPRSYPLALGTIQDPISVSAGDGHASVLARNGVVWLWGQNQDGQLGDGTTYNTNWPKPILSNVIAIKTGGFHTIALSENGTITSWGQNSYGQLGNGDTRSSALPVEVNTLTAVMQIAAGYERSVALKSNGTVWAWGFVRENQGQTPTFDSTPVQVSGLTAVTAIAAGRSHAAAVKSDGTVWAWGSNEYGQLGNASVTGYTANPVQVSNISNAVSVSLTYDHTLVLRSDGTVWAWGANDVGQLGDGTTNATNVAVQVSGLTGVVAIAAAHSYSMAMKADGSVWAWGQDTLFLGIVPGGDVLVPQQTILESLDGNGNVMDDRWEIQYFGNLKQSGDEDFDGDGIPNSQEYQNGTIPNDWYNGQTPYPVYRDHTRVAGKQKVGFPTFHVSNPPRFFLQEVDTSSIEGGNPESQVGGVITTTVDNLDTGHTTVNRTGNPFNFVFAYWAPEYSYSNNDATETGIEHTQDINDDNGGAYDDPPNQVVDQAATLTEQKDHTNEYTTAVLISRALAALPPLPPMEAPYTPLDDATFATIHLFPGEASVYASHSEYRFEWHVSPNLPPFRQITWQEKFVPVSGTPTTTVKHWEGTAMYTDTHTLTPPVPGSYYVIAFAAQIMVDGNRDAEMSLTNSNIYGPDQTRQNQPYRFWLNDDDDTELTEGVPDETEYVPPLHHDFSQHQIVSKRNLEDFARLWINLGGVESTLTSGQVQVALKWKTIDSGTPAINIYPSADGEGSDSYLKDNDAAQAQISGVFNNATGSTVNNQTVDTSGIFVFKTDYWNGLNANGGKKCLLFEGAAEGKGELEVVLLDSGGNQIGEGGSVWMDLKDIKKMYQRKEGYFPDYHSPYNQIPYLGNATSNRDADSLLFTPPAGEDDEVIVFVHGIHGPNFYQSESATLAGWYATSETAFKRLWWQGYKGRFGSYKWGALQPAIPFAFNESEYRGWEFGDGLAAFVNSIPKTRKTLMGHSQGNTLCSYALRWGLVTVENYVAMQAAVPAGCYDPRDEINSYERFLQAEKHNGETPDDTSQLGYRGYLSALSVTGRVINCENPVDYALATGTFWGLASNWEANEVSYKPQTLADRAYYYDPSALDPLQLIVPGSGALIRPVDDHRECLGFLARPRSKALGALGQVAGSVSINIDLNGPPYNFTQESSDHSGEFERPIQKVWDFYDTLLETLQ
jgi:alpha-tubulin suppressor-like RCC1 family protein